MPKPLERVNKRGSISYFPVLNGLGLFFGFVFFLVPFFADSQHVPYKATWKSLSQRPYPQWFKDAKLGIFIHWGVYSVPAYGGKESYAEWYLRGLQLGDSMRTRFMEQHYGSDFEYNDFAPLFKARLFDPVEWSEIFKRSGARYVVLTAKHHDGYALWPSQYARNWNSMEVGPKRDLVGDLASAVRQAGLRMGLYYSLPEWNHPLHRWYTDPHDSIGQYVERHMIPQFKELVGAYRPSLIFADGEWFNSAAQWHSAELIAWYFNLVGDDAVVNNRWGGGSDIGFLTPEYSSGIQATDRPWAEVRGLGRSFGLNRNEKLGAYMTGQELTRFFVKAVANGGGIIINVGPTADGQIPLLQQDRLLQLGEWLEVNGEAIYGASSWKITGEEKPVSVRRIDPNIHFNWVRNTPASPVKEDEFTAEWEGYIEADHPGTYTFEAEADDGVRVWINDQLLINQWKATAETADGNVQDPLQQKASGSISLLQGQRYRVRVKYFEKKQNASIKLYWKRDSHQRVIVPSSVFYTSATGEQQGLNARYNSMQQHLAFTQNHGNVYAITMEWPDETLELNIPRPGKGTEIALLGYDGKLSWKYESKKLIVHTGDIKTSKVKADHAWVFRIKNYK